MQKHIHTLTKGHFNLDFAAACPTKRCHAQTLNSFRFGARARRVENGPRVNQVRVPPGGHALCCAAHRSALMATLALKKDIQALTVALKGATAESQVRIINCQRSKTVRRF